MYSGTASTGAVQNSRFAGATLPHAIPDLAYKQCHGIPRAAEQPAIVLPGRQPRYPLGSQPWYIHAPTPLKGNPGKSL
jgi:hypothetical protein